MLVDSVEPIAATRTGGGLLVQVRQIGMGKTPLTDLQRSKLEGLFTKAAGVAARVQVAQSSSSSSEPAGPAPMGAVQMDAEARAEAAKHPLVKRAMELFEARIVRVEKH